jgi:hypothetical protein
VVRALPLVGVGYEILKLSIPYSALNETTYLIPPSFTGALRTDDQALVAV